MSKSKVELSIGAVAEYLGVPFAHAKAAIGAAGLRDEHGRLKKWFTHADADGPIRALLAARLASIAPPGSPVPTEPTVSIVEEDESSAAFDHHQRRRKR